MPPPADPVDPGAAEVVDRLEAGLAWMELDRPRPVIVGLSRLCNQSRAAPEEFDRLRARLADVLSRAGRQRQLVFTDDAGLSVDVELAGTAYLVTRAGNDEWELFLRLRPARQLWRQWQLSGPVRVLRQPRPNTPQMSCSGQ